MHTEYQPSRLPAPHIDNYQEFKGTPEYGMRIHILPDGCTDFIFALGGAVSEVKEETLAMQPYRSHFVDPMTKYSEFVTYAEFVHQFGVRFLPCELSGFTKLPLHEFVNYGVGMNEMQVAFDSTFIERPCKQNDVRGWIQVVEEYPLAYLVHSHQPVGTQVAAAASTINQSTGKCSARSLTNEVHLCQRHFERKSKYNTGLTPKEYSRIVRFKNAVELLRSTIFVNLLTTTIDAGYYGLAHFLKEVKTLLGNTSSSFLSLIVPEDIVLTYTEPQHRISKSRLFTIERTSVPLSLWRNKVNITRLYQQKL